MIDLQASPVSRAEQTKYIGSEHYFGGALMNRDAHLHPGLLAQGIAERVKAPGARLFG